MKLRRFFLPRTLADFACFLLLFLFVPITFVFELSVVIPEVHGAYGCWFWCYTVLGVFVVFNIQGNMLGCMLVDTSVNSTILRPPLRPVDRKLWHVCHECEIFAPPRSWHCPTCDTCILKRDHHCFFTGYCVGHHNHRYFVCFMVYVTVGAAFATFYNSVYLWGLQQDVYANRSTILKMIFPMLMFTVDASWRNLYLVIYDMNVVAFVYSLTLTVYHMPAVLRGAVMYEKRGESCYDLGWRRNLEMVFGKRMHLAWLSPFIASELPHDGVHWEEILAETSKSR